MTIPLQESIDWCKAITKRTAGNFYFSFVTLPPAQCQDMCVLYAFMRVADDLGDQPGQTVSDRRQALAEYRGNLEDIGIVADHPVFPALHDLIARHGIPLKYFHAVIDGVERDLDFVGFQTFEELSEYCYQVAGAVGLCCIHIWGFHGEDAIPLAIACGMAFQLTNILRDLGEDADMGRVYLPREELERFGYSAEDLLAHRRNAAFDELMQFQVARAKEHYEQARKLFAHLEPSGRSIYAAMLKIYGGVLREIERRHYDVYSQRVKLPRWRKLWISLDSIVRYRWLRSSVG